MKTQRKTEIGAVREAAAKIKGKAANQRAQRARVPTANDLISLDPAIAGVYELSDAEVKKTRSRLYSLNKENACGWKWRSLREGPLLLIWRIH